MAENMAVCSFPDTNLFPVPATNFLGKDSDKSSLGQGLGEKGQSALACGFHENLMDWVGW
jgi:hypothetical protein